MLHPFLQPFSSSAKILFSSSHFDSLLFKMDENILYMALASVIHVPRCGKGPCFARVCSNVNDFNKRNTFLASKLFKRYVCKLCYYNKLFRNFITDAQS